MFVLRLGSSWSTLIHTENMPPPVKKTRTDYMEESEKAYSELSIESDPGTSSKQAFINETEEVLNVNIDWRENCNGVCSKNSFALKNKILSDVKFVVGQEQMEFSCHRLILALGSPVFEAMFYGTLAETSDTITIPDVEPVGFKHLVSFLYSDTFSFNTDVAAFQTYFAADKYCVSELKRRCDKYLCLRKLTPFNVWTFLEYSLLLNSSTIKNRCLDFLMQDTKYALQHISFLELSPRAIETFLSAEDLDIDEVDLIRHVIRWAEHHAEGKEVEIFQTTLRPLLQHMRFSFLKPQEFVTIRKNTRLSEVINDQSSLAILEHIINPKDCALPDWCCVKMPRKKKSKKDTPEKGRITPKRSVAETFSRRYISESSSSSISSAVQTISSSEESDS